MKPFSKRSNILFDLKTIHASLSEVLQSFEEINAKLTSKREALTKQIIDNILCAYDYCNSLLREGIDLFNPVGIHSMLELNHIVLCGDEIKKRTEFYAHLQETRSRFQQNIRPILEWYSKEKDFLDPYSLAAGFYIRALSQPQLFFEGNHRTENIVMNYILIGFEKNPFVLEKHTAFEYFEPSSQTKFSDKRTLRFSWFVLPKYTKKFQSLLLDLGNAKFLRRKKST